MVPLLRKVPAYRGQSAVARPRWFVADNADVKVMLGLSPKAKLPAEGLPARNIDGVQVYVAPLDPNRKRRKGHRVRANCPVCFGDFSLGRIGQHLAIHLNWQPEKL